MPKIVYFPAHLCDGLKELLNILAKNDFNIEISDDADMLVLVDEFNNEIEINFVCGELKSEIDILKDFINILKTFIYLGLIDEKLQKKEFKKYKDVFLQAYAYLQLINNDDIDIETLSEIEKYYDHKDCKTFDDNLSEKEIISMLYDILKNQQKFIEEEVEKLLNCANIHLNLNHIEIKKFLLTEQFPKELNLSKAEKEDFETLLANNLSLERETKINIIVMLPTCSKSQIDSLKNAFTDDCDRFKHNVEELKTRSINTWKYIETNFDMIVRIKSAKLFHEELSRFIIGQDKPLKSIANALYNHRLARIQKANDINFGPIMMYGSTGCGKSFIAQKASEILGLDFLHVDCSLFVSEGIVGQGIQDVFKLLLKQCNFVENRYKHAIIFFDEFDKLLLKDYQSDIISQLLLAIEGTDFAINTTHKDHDELKGITSIDTRKMFFLLGGSFEHILKEKNANKSGFLNQDNASLKEDDILSFFPRELSGRVKKIVTLNRLNEQDYYKILTKSKNSPLNFYKTAFKLHDKNIEFKEETLRNIAKNAVKSPYGARILHSLIGEICDEMLYEIDTINEQEILV